MILFVSIFYLTFAIQRYSNSNIYISPTDDDPPRVKGVTFSNTVEENSIPELTVREELDDTRNWRKSCPIGDNGDVKKIDLKVIEPYKKVLSHGGYYHHYNSALSNKNNTEAGKLTNMRVAKTDF